VAIKKYIPFLILSFLGGVFARSFFNVSIAVIFTVVGMLCGLGIIALASKEFSGIFFWVLIAATFALGMARFYFFENKINDDQLHKRYGQQITIQGTVISSTMKTKSSKIVLHTRDGKLLLIGQVHPQYKYGDLLSVSGVLFEPPTDDTFDTAHVLAKDNIYSEMLFPHMKKVGYAPESKIVNILFKIKDAFEEKLKLILPSDNAALADGMLLGNEGSADQSLVDAFRKTGTIHILVLSGYNITVVGAFLILLFGYFLPSLAAFFISASGIILFTLMTGATASAVRAAIMAIVGLIAAKTGRLSISLNSLFLSAASMVLINPMLMRFDRGFQLSFLATLGLILVSPVISKKLRFLPNFLSIRENAASSLSVELFVIPLLLSWGAGISLLSPVANILIVGVVPAVMLFSFLGATLSFLSLTVGVIVVSPTYLLTNFQIGVAKFLAGFESFIVSFNYIPSFLLFLIYVLLFSWAIKRYVEIY